MTLNLKLTGLHVDGPRYPQPGTKLATIIECLEAEPATLREVADYLKVDSVDQVTGLLSHLRKRGIVRKAGGERWELVDPVAVAERYGGIV